MYASPFLGPVQAGGTQVKAPLLSPVKVKRRRHAGWSWTPWSTIALVTALLFLWRALFFGQQSTAVVLSRQYVQAQFPRGEMLAVRRTSLIVMRVFVFTMDRVQSLQRLIQSLASARFDLVTTPIMWDLNIIVDALPLSADTKSRNGHKDVLDYVRTLAWPHGDLTIRTAAANTGLKASILGAWEPVAGTNEMALFLEDDISLSPLFPVWTERAVLTYYYGQDHRSESDELFGVALYAPKWSQVTDRSWSPDGTGKPVYEPYLSQLPCSWGAIYFAGPWRRFLDWYRSPEGGMDGRVDPLVPNLTGINWWPHEKSWKKYLVRFMVETGGFMLYPNLPGGASFSTNYMETGANEKTTILVSSGKSFTILDRYHVPLVPDRQWTLSGLDALLPMPPLHRLRTFDVFEVVVPALVSSKQGSRAALADVGTVATETVAVTTPPRTPGQKPRPGGTPARAGTTSATEVHDAWHIPLKPASFWSAYKKFTIVVTSNQTRLEKLTRFLVHYSRCPSVDAIVVVWNDVGGKDTYPLPVAALQAIAHPALLTVLTMPSYDINNRFLPHKEIGTDAILSLDDDAIIDLSNVEFAFYLWQMRPANLVGFRWMTRGYVPCPTRSGGETHGLCDGDTYQYVSDPPASVESWKLRSYHFPLTGAAFMHRLYLHMYSGVPSPMHVASINTSALAPGVMQSVRRWVSDQDNCEDLAMNFMVTATTGGQPAFIVEGVFNTTNTTSSKIQRQNLGAVRSRCIDKMVSLFGKEALPPNVRGFPQAWQDQWRNRPLVPADRTFLV